VLFLDNLSYQEANKVMNFNQTKRKKENIFDGIVGSNKLMKDLQWKIELAAENNVTVLINGESGTGKELVAHAIHKNSDNCENPFIPINMGVISKDIASNEFFGHEKGSFTGATNFKDGVFDAAQGGTIFLDEISCLNLNTQSALLRILENKEFRRVGGKKTIKTDARIIAATNVNLRNAVNQGTFRKDLYYRLEVFSISIPPLRNRWDDIPLLVDHFINLFNKEMGLNIQKVTSDALECLIRYEWPGNVRELKNAIQQAMLLSKNKVITKDHLSDNILSENAIGWNQNLPMGLPLKEVEKRYITTTLKWVRGNKVKAANALGISRRALYNKIAFHNL
jgi:transcriptional regulator with PAS, ATPase and Fis domain